MNKLRLNGWIVTTKAGEPARRRLMQVDGSEKRVPKVTIGRRPPTGEQYVKRVVVTIEEIPATAKEGAC
jgi:hypothetical protein